MLLDSPITDGKISIGGREYGTAEHIAKAFKKCERTIRRWGLPRIKVGNLVLYDLDRIPAWLAAFEIDGAGPPPANTGGLPADYSKARDQLLAEFPLTAAERSWLLGLRPPVSPQQRARLSVLASVAARRVPTSL